MAFVRNFNPDDNQAEVTGQTQGINNTPTITTAIGTDAVAQQGGVAAPNRQTGSGTFTNLQRYLTANAGGAENLGGQLANQIETSKQAAQTGMQTATGAFGQKVAEGTNIFNPDVVNAAAQDASAYVANESLQKQLSGQYAGPTAYAGSPEDVAAQKALMAAREKQLLAGTVGGRTQLLRNVEPQTTQGGLALNQFLVQNTQPVYNRVAGAAAGIEPLAEQYAGQMTGAAQQIQQAKQTSAETRRQALARLGQGTTDLQAQINQQLAQRQAQIDAAARKQFTTLEAAGATPEQIAAYQTALAGAQQYGKPGVDLANYFTPEVAARLGTADVATAAQAEDLAALAQLTGTQNRFLQAGQAGVGPRIDLGSILGQLQTQQTEGMYAKQLADQQAAAAAAAAAQQAAYEKQQEEAAAEYARQQAAQQAQLAAAAQAQREAYAAQQAEIARQQAEARAAAEAQLAAQQAAANEANRIAQEQAAAQLAAYRAQQAAAEQAAAARQKALEDQLAALLAGQKTPTTPTTPTPETPQKTITPVTQPIAPGEGSGPGGDGGPSSTGGPAGSVGGGTGSVGGGVTAGTIGTIGNAIGTATGIGAVGTVGNVTGLSQAIANAVNASVAASNNASVANAMGLTPAEAATPEGQAATAAAVDSAPVAGETQGTAAAVSAADAAQGAVGTTGAAAAAAGAAAAASAAAAGASDAAQGAAASAAASAAIGGASASAAAAAGAAAAAAADAGANAAAADAADAAAADAASNGGVGVGSSSSAASSADAGPAGADAGVGVGSAASSADAGPAGADAGVGVGASAAGDSAAGVGAAPGSVGSAGGEGPSGDGAGGGGGGGKIICTAMNDMYGLPYRENKVWLKYSVTHMKPEHQAGYHKVFLPLVDFAFKKGDALPNRLVRKLLVSIAVNRTQDIEDELAGRNPRWIKRALVRKPAEWLIYQIGKWSKK